MKKRPYSWKENSVAGVTINSCVTLKPFIMYKECEEHSLAKLYKSNCKLYCFMSHKKHHQHRIPGLQ